MGLLFRALGAAAAVNNTLGRYSLNFIPSNVILGAVAASIFVINVSGWLEAVEAGSAPQAVRLADLAQGRTRGATFVRTAGLVVGGEGFQYGEQDANGNIKRVTMEFMPMIDRESGRGVFVQFPAGHRFRGGDREVELVGMLRPMQEFLARELRRTRFEFGGVRMLAASVLVVDASPGEAASWRLGAILSAAPVALLLLLTVKRNTIFRRGAVPPPDSAAAGQGTPELRATGTFVLDKHTRRFIDIPAVVAPLENGDMGVFANVDASSNFMGVTYAKRSGMWVLPIARGSVQGVEEGMLYYGTRARPAARFTYRDALSNRSRTAIISVSTQAACRALVGELTAIRAGAATRPA